MVSTLLRCQITTQAITKKFRLQEKDTASTDVQIAILTELIAEISEELRGIPTSKDTRLKLIRAVGKRRKLLEYLQGTDTRRYNLLIAKLGMIR